jgi:hypothetical protein
MDCPEASGHLSAAYTMTMLEAYTTPSIVAGSNRAMIPLWP